MQPGKGGGILAVDFDDDGDIDLFAPTAAGIPNRLYQNEQGTFLEMAASVGLDSRQAARAALWFDYDGDHLLDLIVGGDCYNEDNDEPCQDALSLILYQQQDNGQFRDVTTEAGITTGALAGSITHRGGISAGDINNDGYLDLLFALWLGDEAIVLLNNTDGTFTNIGERSGIGSYRFGFNRYYQHVLHDFDHDGYLDVFSANDNQANRLWINQHDNTFDDIGNRANINDTFNGMGLTLGDYDNDGDFDVFVTNIQSNVFFSSFRHHILYRNISIGTDIRFEDVSEAAQVISDAEEDRQVGWGTTFLDADNDGLLDLAITNGMRWHELPWATQDRSVFFQNLGGDPPTFANVSDQVAFNDTLFGSSLVAFDYDRDGRLDIAQTIQSTETENGEYSRIRLLHNLPAPQQTTQNYLVIKPRIQGPNHRAIGAVIRVHIGEQTLSRLITAGTSFLGQEPAEAHFGLGNADAVDNVTIEWPDGATSQFHPDNINQIYIASKTALSLPGPTISLIGGQTITVECGTQFIDPGATARDAEGNDITDNIVVLGADALDTALPGNYTITYDVTDTNNKPAIQRTRQVTVQDTTAPTITLNNQYIILTCNQDFTDPGAITATDTCNGDLANSIQIGGDTIDDNARQRVYRITYTVTDNAANTATTTQFVTVNCLPENPTLSQIANTLANNQSEFDGNNDNHLDQTEATIAIPQLTNQQFNDLDTNQNDLLDNDELGIAEQPKAPGCHATPITPPTPTNPGDATLILLTLLALLRTTPRSKQCEEQAYSPAKETVLSSQGMMGVALSLDAIQKLRGDSNTMRNRTQ